MPRPLAREESYVRGIHRKTNQPYPLAEPTGVVECGPADHAWFGKPVDDAERARVLAAAAELMPHWTRADHRSPVTLNADAQRPLIRLLDWLDSFPGESYQDRWLAAEPDARPGSWCPELAMGASRHDGARHAAHALILLGVIRPSYTWTFDNKAARLWRDWTIVNDKAAWDRYFTVADQEGVPQRKKWVGAQHLIRLCMASGFTLQQLRRDHVLAYRRFLQDTNRATGEMFSMWHYARLIGLFAGEPDDFGALVRATPRTPTQIVDRFQITSPQVRGLLIDYLTEMSTTQDYGSLEASAANLIGLFWKPVEIANPGIDTIKLTKDQAAAWKAWLPTKPNGGRRMNADSVMGTVRSFYLDLAAWAHEDPARWAPWAVPCPVGVHDVRGMGKRKAARTHRMQARTRTLAPFLPQFAQRAKQRYDDAVELQNLVRQTPIGEPFTFAGHSYIRHRTGRLANSTSYVTMIGQQERIDTDWRVVSTFMTWSFVEVLRHTGLRIEEMLELTHLSIRKYRKPDSTVLPLLQVAPSKNDEERILPCSPELSVALARLIEFVSIDGRVPLCVRRDNHERTFSAPLPHLFQVREAGRSRTISPGTVRNWLIDLAEDIDLRDVDGRELHFTPHDFRRLFITDLVNSGFPIHLAAKLVGHHSLDVTSGYTAVYQTDVFDAYDRFITTRRALRPTDEYREPTQQEWEEFVEHFGQRKIALGSCHRPYGATCVHEHACIRCDFLQIDPAQAGRLTDIRTNLEAQIAEAERNQWLGDVDQLRLTIQHADRKTEQLLQQIAALAQPLVVAQRAG